MTFIRKMRIFQIFFPCVRSTTYGSTKIVPPRVIYSMDLGMFKFDLLCLLDPEALQEIREECGHSCVFVRL